MSTCNKRITAKLKQPNPLFVKWLTEWNVESKQKNSKMEHCFAKALQSMKKYPLPLETGADCKILDGFGDKLCKMLDKKLTNRTGVDAAPQRTVPETKRNGTNGKKTTVNKSPESYVPEWRSGGYAILLSLYNKSLQTDYRGFLNKNEIIKEGQRLSDKSFTKSDPGTFYTAWSSMKTLLAKGLVCKVGNPAKFSLNDSGIRLAKMLADKDVRDTLSNELTDKCVPLQSDLDDFCTKLDGNTVDVVPVGESSSQCSSATSVDNCILSPHSFEIILLVDTQETSGKHSMHDELLENLIKAQVNYEVRHLNVGDFAWICRERSSRKELVLPYVIERKRMDDLGASIKDGRFHEQKYRLKQSGIQNLIYLIESHGKNEHTGLPILSLYQAATNTLVQDGFLLKYTDSLQNTVHYLKMLTDILENNFKSKTLICCEKKFLESHSITDEIISVMSFTEFNKASSKAKNFKVKDFFVRQLLQLKGLSVEKALAIVQEFPTPLLLCAAFDNCPRPENMLSTLRYGKLRKCIGPVLSKSLYGLYMKNEF